MVWDRQKRLCSKQTWTKHVIPRIKSLYSFISLLCPFIPNPRWILVTTVTDSFTKIPRIDFMGIFSEKIPEMRRFRVRFITLKWFLVLNIFSCDSSNIIPPLFHIFYKIGSLRSPVLKWSTQNSSKVLSGRHFLHPFFTYMRSTSHFIAKRFDFGPLHVMDL